MLGLPQIAVTCSDGTSQLSLLGRSRDRQMINRSWLVAVVKNMLMWNSPW